jgi:oligopeptide/dipeptide ABC transporter ATP-binding protein
LFRHGTGRLDLVTAAQETAPAPAAAGHRHALVEIQGLTVDFDVSGSRFKKGTRIVRAVDDVDLLIERGKTLGLVGGTGSGKSTIAQVVMGIVTPTAGKVMIAGREPLTLSGKALQAHRQRVQVVLQDPYSSLDPRMRVGDIIAEPLTLGRPGAGRNPAIKARVIELLGLVGLPAAKADLYPHQFSGGQRQRIAIARALAPAPEIIVLDEPTSALDVSVRAQILTLLKRLQDQLNVTYLVISHDLVSVAYLASTVAVMYAGRIVEIGPTREIYRAAKHPYTLLLHESAPNADGAFLRVLQPAILAPRADGIHTSTDGCRYASRCGLRVRLGNPARCLDEEPLLLEQGIGHQAACHFPEQAARISDQLVAAEEAVDAAIDVAPFEVPSRDEGSRPESPLEAPATTTDRGPG